MIVRLIRNKKLSLALAVLFMTTCFLLWKTHILLRKSHASGAQSTQPVSSNNLVIQQHRLAVIVPFRDRFDELVIFVPHISKFILAQGITNFQILIINQSSRYRFNRGALANVGYSLAKNSSDYIAIHDVDLLPINKDLSYRYPARGPYHLASPKYHPQYNYDNYFGGILLINNQHYESVNGMSNRYFGWGLEDDEFFTRITSASIPMFRPDNLTTNTSNTFLHVHYSNRRRDVFKSKEQRDSSKRRDRVTGLNNLKFSVTSKHDLSIDILYRCTVFNVEIHCDIKQTPWCMPNRSQPIKQQ